MERLEVSLAPDFTGFETLHIRNDKLLRANLSLLLLYRPLMDVLPASQPFEKFCFRFIHLFYGHLFQIRFFYRAAHDPIKQEGAFLHVARVIMLGGHAFVGLEFFGDVVFSPSTSHQLFVAFD